MMRYFWKPVKKTKTAMVAFLKKHPRYHTMNSWNLSHSYAQCVKLHSLPLDRWLTKPQIDMAYEFLEVDGEEQPWLDIRTEWENFSDRHNQDWTISANGRSSGYFVLYATHKKPGFRSRCQHCGQGNFKRAVPVPLPGSTHLVAMATEAMNELRLGKPGDYVKQQGWSDADIDARLAEIRIDVEVNGPWIPNQCGRCHTIGKMFTFEKQLVDVQMSCAGIDMDRDYEAWSLSELRNKVDLVQDFDRTCDWCLQVFVDCCKTLKVVEQRILVPKTVKTVVDVEADHGCSGETVADAG